MPKKDTARATEDIVRVLRVIEYVGPRSWVEATVELSIKGVLKLANGGKIGAAVVGDYPEILVRQGTFVRDSDADPRTHFVKVDNAPKAHPADIMAQGYARAAE